MALRVITGPHAFDNLSDRAIENAEIGLRVNADEESPNDERHEDDGFAEGKIVSPRLRALISPSMVRWKSRRRYVPPMAMLTTAQKAQFTDIW